MLLSSTFLPAALPEDEASEECLSALDTFEPCAMEAVNKIPGLHMNFSKAVAKADSCFDDAADDAAKKAACLEPLFGMFKEACPSSIDDMTAKCGTNPSSDFGDFAMDAFEDISADLEDAAEDEEEDEFIAVEGECMRLRCLGGISSFILL